ncbi:hypothetical protein CRV24_006406 [Beauveria bassiana]|nr:hypothetical protein CRV24_006406 [Beauveria bassiana]KAH8715424.1 hypothetical protein HC256_004246 [Beauveria bassiana]
MAIKGDPEKVTPPVSMLSVDELDRHRQLESVTLRYGHTSETVSYEWSARGGKPSDCWTTKDGRVYLPADITSVMLTEFFHHEIVWSPEEQRIRYIRTKQLKDADSRKTQKMVLEIGQRGFGRGRAVADHLVMNSRLTELAFTYTTRFRLH